MGLLRAAAEVVLIGSGTLQASPNGLWTPESTYPDAADGWAELRRRLGRPPEPALAVITGSGGVDPNHPAFERGALVLTTDAGAQALSGLLPAASEVVALGDGPLVDVGVARSRRCEDAGTSWSSSRQARTSSARCSASSWSTSCS